MATSVTSATDGYRNYWDEYLKNGDSTGKTEETSSSGNVYNAVFTDEENGVTIDDFLTLMVAQLQNQDFMNPVDDTQYVTQLAQFATMQQMQEMASYMKTNYVLSLIGQNVTAAKFTVAGDLNKQTGPIQKVSLVDNEYVVYVNGEQFSLEQIMEINGPGSSSTDDDSGIENPSLQSYLMSLIGKNVTIRKELEDGKTEDITGIVSRVSMEKGEYKVCIDDEWYDLSQVIAANEVPVEEPDEGETPEGEDGTGTDTDTKPDDQQNVQDAGQAGQIPVISPSETENTPVAGQTVSESVVEDIPVIEPEVQI